MLAILPAVATATLLTAGPSTSLNGNLGGVSSMFETPIDDTNVDPISPRLDSYDLRLLTALRQGDEAAFVILVNQHHNAMVRLAMTYVPNRGVAEEVAQEAWLGVLRGLDRFEGRSSLKTWIFRILVNRAKTRGQRESRSIPLTALWDPQGEPDEASVDPERFLPPDHPRWPHHWASFPESWDEIPEERILHQEIRTIVEETIEKLPPNQRQVITLRDIDGWTAKEVCNVLQVSETNQRVLLHRARSKVRGALEQYLMSGEDT